MVTVLFEPSGALARFSSVADLAVFMLQFGLEWEDSTHKTIIRRMLVNGQRTVEVVGRVK